MLFSNLVMYFIMLSTGTALFHAGKHEISSAAEAAQALRPTCRRRRESSLRDRGERGRLSGRSGNDRGRGLRPCADVGLEHSLHARLGEAKGFYGAMAAVTAVAIGLNFLGFNPMRALVLAGVVQGFSAPPLLILIMLITSDRASMGPRVNGTTMKVLGWSTTVISFCAAGALVVSWFR